MASSKFLAAIHEKGSFHGWLHIILNIAGDDLFAIFTQF